MLSTLKQLTFIKQLNQRKQLLIQLGTYISKKMTRIIPSLCLSSVHDHSHECFVEEWSVIQDKDEKHLA